MEVSDIVPPLAPIVFAEMAVGTAVIEPVIVSFAANPSALVSLLVTSIRIRAVTVSVVVPPLTTVRDVSLLGPTATASDCEICALAGAIEVKSPELRQQMATSAIRFKVNRFRPEYTCQLCGEMRRNSALGG